MTVLFALKSRIQESLKEGYIVFDASIIQDTGVDDFLNSIAKSPDNPIFKLLPSEPYQIEINNPSISEIEDNKLSVKGNIILPGKIEVSSQAEAVFSLSERGRLIFYLKLTLGASWKFSDSFPVLKNSLFDNLKLTSPHFLLSSEDNYRDENISLKRGLSFHAEAVTVPDISGPATLKPDTTFLPDDVKHFPNLLGLIDLGKDPYELELKTDLLEDSLSFPLKVQGLGEVKLDKPSIALASVNASAKDGQISRQNKAFLCAACVDLKSYRLAFEIPSGLPEAPTLWTGSFIKDQKTIPITDLLNVVCPSLDKIGGLESFFPESLLEVLNEAIGIDNLSLKFSLAENTVSVINFDVHIGKSWTIIDDQLITLKIGKIGFSFIITHIPKTELFDEDTLLQVVLHGAVVLGKEENEVEVDIDLHIPSSPHLDWMLAVSETSDKNLTVEHLSNLLGNTNLKGIGLPEKLENVFNFGISDIQLSFNPFEISEPSFFLKALYFRIFYEPEWQIFDSPKLTLNKFNLHFNVDYPFESDQRSIRWDIEGTINFAGVDINLLLSSTTSTDKNIKGGLQFKGGTAPDQAIPIGQFIEDIAKEFRTEIQLPEPLKELSINNFGVEFNTGSKDFHLVCAIEFPLNDKRKLDLVFKIDLIHKDGGQYTHELGGTFNLGFNQFGLIFDQQGMPSRKSTQTFLAAFYKHEGDAQGLNLNKLIEDFLDENDKKILESLPEIDLKDMYLVIDRSKSSDKPSSRTLDSPEPLPQQGTKTHILFGGDLGVNIDLSNLPLVGKSLSGSQGFGLENLQLQFASRHFTDDEASAVSSLLSDRGIQALLSPSASKEQPSSDDQNGSSDSSSTVSIAQGLRAAVNLNMGGTAFQQLTLGGSRDSSQRILPLSSSETLPSEKASVPSPGDDVSWFKIDKSFGPVHFARIGGQYKSNELWFFLDAALKVTGLSISVNGLSVGSSLKDFSPRFNIRGLGVDFKQGGLEIGGALLKQSIYDSQDPPQFLYDEYDGGLVIKMPSLSIGALAAYAQFEGQTSLFAYATVNAPMGGPIFLQVKGLALGFGYNRSLLIPPINQIISFPLVSEALGDLAPNADLMQEVARLKDYIPLTMGEYFLAVGLRINSFNIVDVFALLSVSFGKHFEINLLGMGTLLVPPEAGVSPLAEIQIALKATFDPEKGFVELSAQLTNNSYIFSRTCHLTGGFAASFWFSGEHAGDFVITLGGYHPHYAVPAHYPQPPRLGFNWQVDDSIVLKGGIYFALTPIAFMAGGSFEASYQRGSVHAWFNAGADFLIGWKPYHYEAEIYVNLGARVSFIHVEIGSDLKLWGPEFGGEAKVHLWIVSFTVSFGSDSPYVPPLDWREFRSSFLPEKKGVCSIVAQGGLSQMVPDLASKDSAQRSTLLESESQKRWIINPKDFALTIQSVVPFNEIPRWKNKDADHSISSIARILEKRDLTTEDFYIHTDPIGIAPMAVSKITSQMLLCLKRDGKFINTVEEEFSFLPVVQTVPAALWGTKRQPKLDDKGVDAVIGYTLVSKGSPEKGETHLIDLDNLAYEVTENDSQFSFGVPLQIEVCRELMDNQRKSFIQTEMEKSLGNETYKNIFSNFEFSEDLKPLLDQAPCPSVVDAFLLSPQIIWSTL